MRNSCTFFVAILSVFLFSMNVLAQNDVYNYIKIQMKSEQNVMTEMMRPKYEKEVYFNDKYTYCIRTSQHKKEIIQYNSDKEPIAFYILEGSKLYVNTTFPYKDEEAEALSSEEQSFLKNQFVIQRDVTKEIVGKECFKVIMNSPSSGSPAVEMFVSEDFPNYPSHFPLPSFLINAEPLETTLHLMGKTIEIGITQVENGIVIENHLNLDFKSAIAVDDKKYDLLRSTFK
ncbi:MAG: hypothetical protein P1U56_03050 [Saprospiraceae bacterium]|nr:hypothetical protein [Saprospiraceae bacterium]